MILMKYSNQKPFIHKFMYDDQWVFKVSFIMLFTFEAYRFLISSIVTQYIGQNVFDTLFCIVITYPFYINTIIKFFKRHIKYDVLYVYLIILILFFGSALFYPDNRINLFEALIRALPFVGAYFFIRLINDTKVIIDSLKKIAYIYFICYLPFPFFNNATDYGVLDDGLYMSYGYAMYIPAIIFLYFAFKGKNIFYLLLSLISLTGILVWGNRGPLIAYFGFGVLYLLFSQKKKILFNSLLVTLCMGSIGYLFSNKQLLNNILYFLSNFGFTSRTIELWLRNDISESSGRDYIQTTIFNALQKNNYSGFGVVGDRFILDGQYSHNIIIELFVSFGPIFSLIIIAILLYFSMKMFITCKSQNHKELFIIFFSLSFFRLMLSSSFWYEPTFYAAIAVVVSYYKNHNRPNVTQEPNNPFIQKGRLFNR